MARTEAELAIREAERIIKEARACSGTLELPPSVTGAEESIGTGADWPILPTLIPGGQEIKAIRYFAKFYRKPKPHGNPEI